MGPTQRRDASWRTDLSLLSFDFLWIPDPDRTMTCYHFENSQIHTGYTNSEVDDLIEQGRQTMGNAERKGV